jgi:hypothetical protein
MPLDTAIALMKSGNVKMHGPEHHFLVRGIEVGAFSGAITCEFFHLNKECRKVESPFYQS